jgi:hypothetical protein
MLIVVALLVWFAVSHSPNGSTLPAGAALPGGSVGGGSHGSNLAGEIGGDVCKYGATAVAAYYTGGAGAAAGYKAGSMIAPLCSAVAPYVVKGAKFIGKEAAAGAEFVAKETVAGAKEVYTGGKAAVSFAADPTAPLRLAGGVTKAIGNVQGITDRLANKAYSSLPTPLKYAAAPVLVTEKITSAVTKKTAAAVGKVAGALQSGAKSAEHAVSSAAHAVLGFL